MPIPFTSIHSYLPAEIVGETFSYLTSNDISTYFALTLTSKAIRKIADIYLYRDLPYLPPPVSFDAACNMLEQGPVPYTSKHSIPRSILLLRKLVDRPELQIQVRSFCIQRFDYLCDPTEWHIPEELIKRKQAAAQDVAKLLKKKGPVKVEPVGRCELYYHYLGQVLAGMTNLRELTIAVEDPSIYKKVFPSALQTFIAMSASPKRSLVYLTETLKPDLYFFLQMVVKERLLVRDGDEDEDQDQDEMIDVDMDPDPDVDIDMGPDIDTDMDADGTVTPQTLLGITTEAFRHLHGNGLPEADSTIALGAALSLIPTRPYVLEKLTVEDRFAPETYLDSLRRVTTLKSLVLHGSRKHDNLLRPIHLMENNGSPSGNAMLPLGSYESPSVWPELQMFEGCIEDLPRILPNRQYLTDLCIVDSRGRLDSIGIIDSLLMGFGLGNDFLERVWDGLSCIEKLEIRATKLSGAFKFEHVSSAVAQATTAIPVAGPAPPPPQRFLWALKSVQTLILPQPLTRDSKVCPLSFCDCCLD